MNTYVDPDGVENIAIGVVGQARKDFIKGAKVLYSILHYIPSYNDLIKDVNHHTLTNNQDVRYMYDAWRFVQKDPYEMFGDAGEDQVINSWKSAAILKYYEKNYIYGASILLGSSELPKKDLKDIDDSTVNKILNDKKVADDFIAARNYVCSLPDGEDTIKQWNATAYERIRKRIKVGCRKRIQDTDYQKRMRARKEENIRKAKEYREAGISIKAIAKYLGVQEQTVFNYLRS